MDEIIVDGYNVIHLAPALKRFLEESLQRARDELIRGIQAYLLNKKLRITVVFDGAPMAGSEWLSRPSDRLVVIFSKRPHEGDALIKTLIGKAANVRKLTVVTQDLDIQNYARQMRAKVLLPIAFYDRLAKRRRDFEYYSKKFDHDLSADELDAWLHLFGEK